MRRLAAFAALLFCGQLLATEPARAASVRFAGAPQTRSLWERWFASYGKTRSFDGAFEAVDGASSVRKVAGLQIDAAALLEPLGAAQLAAAPSLVDLPVAISAVAIVYNVVVAGDLRLTPELIDGILRGRITRWRDPAVLAANPGVVLPDLPIAVFTQPEEAGDTQTLRDYLVHALGRGAALSPWTGTAPPDPRALADSLKRTDGSFAYLDAALARRSDLYLASVRNRDGAFLQPSMRSLTHAAVGVRLPDDFRASIVDARGPEAYPIASFTHAIVDGRLPAARRQAVTGFLRWVLHEGQQQTIALGYAPLPGLVVRALDARLAQLEPPQFGAR